MKAAALAMQKHKKTAHPACKENIFCVDFVWIHVLANILLKVILLAVILMKQSAKNALIVILDSYSFLI